MGRVSRPCCLKIMMLMIYVAMGIYLVFSLLNGPTWPFSMFAKGGPIGKIIVGVWVVLLITAFANR